MRAPLFPSFSYPRFDSIKYDVKKIEGVIYDLSIRGLLKDGGASA